MMPNLPLYLMTLAEAKARANKTFIVQVSLTNVTYDCNNIFIVHATVLNAAEPFLSLT